MFVMRMTEQVKQGCTDKLIEFLESWPDDAPAPPHGWRIYWPTQFGPWNEVIFEADFESLAEHEEWWKEFWASPRSGEWLEKKGELTERGGRGELWHMKVMK